MSAAEPEPLHVLKSPRKVLPQRNNLRKLGLTDSTPCLDPSKLLRKKYETDRLSELTHLSSDTIHAIFGEVKDSSEDMLDKIKFQTAMLRHGVTLFADPEVLDSFFLAVDKNHDGSIQKKELICALTAYSSGTLTEKLRLGFSVFDISHDGQISPEEMRRMLSHMGTVTFSASEGLEGHVDELVQRVFEQYDTNNDGHLSLDEFIAAAESNEELKRLFTLESALDPLTTSNDLPDPTV